MNLYDYGHLQGLNTDFNLEDYFCKHKLNVANANGLSVPGSGIKMLLDGECGIQANALSHD